MTNTGVSQGTDTDELRSWTLVASFMALMFCSIMLLGNIEDGIGVQFILNIISIILLLITFIVAIRGLRKTQVVPHQTVVEPTADPMDQLDQLV